MDPPSPSPSSGSVTGPSDALGSAAAAARNPNPSSAARRAALLRHHLRLEDSHTSRALASAGVDSLEQQLLTELRDLYLAEPQDPPPERLGPYHYSLRSGPDGGLLAYVRTPAPAEQSDAETDGGGAGRGRQQQQRQRPAAPLEAPPEVLLSRELVARDARVASRVTGLRLGDSVGALKLCPHHRLLAYSLPVADVPDVFCVLVRDTATGQLVLPGGVVGGVAGPGGMELAADGRSLLVLAADPAGRPDKVVLHDLRCASPPRVLLRETDPRFFLALGRTKDWALLLININSKTSSEVHVLDADAPAAHPPRLVQPRSPGLEYFVEHHRPPANRPPTSTSPHAATRASDGPSQAEAESEGQLIILTNADLRAQRGGGGGGGGRGAAAGGGGAGRRGAGGGGELSVVTAPLSRPGLEHWRPLLPGRPGVVVTDMDVFADCVVLYERRQGLPAVSVLPLAGLAAAPAGAVGTAPGAHGDTDADVDGVVGGDAPPAVPVPVLPEPLRVPLPPWALHVSPGVNADPLSPTLRLTASSPLHPPATFDYRLPTRHPPAPHHHLAPDPGRGLVGHDLRLLASEQPPPAAARLLRACSLVQLQLVVGEERATEEAAEEERAAEAERAGTTTVVGTRAAAERRDGGAGGGGNGSEDGSDGVAVPVTLVLPPGVEFPFPSPGGATAEAGNGVPRFTWRRIWGPEPQQRTQTQQQHQQQHQQPGDGATSGREGAPSLSSGGGSGGGARPLLLSVYGAYGMPLELPYDPSLLCLLARGWAVAKVHVRGGGELGRRWHAAGCRHRKRAAVEDCLAALRLLTATHIDPPGGAAANPANPAAGASARPSSPLRAPPALGVAGDSGGHATRASAAPTAVPLTTAAAAASSGWTPLTAPGLVAGHAVSAGGVVLGAALNAAPGVFGAAVFRCAFLELLGPCSDPGQPLTAHEWDEWGDPTDPRDWTAMGELCPYTNLDAAVAGGGGGVDGGGGREGWRAAVLASCAEGDPRVEASIPAKWVARLRDRLRRTIPPGMYDNGDDVDDVTSRAGAGGGDGGGISRWSRLLGRLWSRSGSGSRSRRDTARVHWDASGVRPAGQPEGRAPGGDTGAEGAQLRGRSNDGARASASDGRARDGVSGCGGRGGGGGGGDGSSGGGGGGSAGGGGTASGGLRRGVCAPLLRVHFDGAGHVREGHAAQAEEAVEELAFLLVAMGGEREGREGEGAMDGRAGSSSGAHGADRVGGGALCGRGLGWGFAKQQLRRSTQDDGTGPGLERDDAHISKAVNAFVNQAKASSDRAPSPDIDVPDYVDDWFALESSAIRTKAASKSLDNLQLGPVSDRELFNELPMDWCMGGEGEASDEGEAPSGDTVAPGSAKVPAKAELEEHLIGKLQDAGGGEGFVLAGRNWHVTPGRDNKGRGDLAFSCPGGGMDLVVEVKYLNLSAHGRTAVATRRKKRRKVIERAVSYAVEWHRKAVGAGRSVIAAAYTNEHGLVQLAWLLGRPSLGEFHSRLCVQVCREGEALQSNDVECVATSLRDAGYTFFDMDDEHVSEAVRAAVSQATPRGDARDARDAGNRAPSPDICVQDNVYERLNLESLRTSIEAASNALHDLQLGPVSDLELVPEPSPNGCSNGQADGEAGAGGASDEASGEGEAPDGNAVALGSAEVPTEAELEEHLIGKLQKAGGGDAFVLAGRNWHVTPGLEFEGRGDLAFSCPGGGVDLVVEVKYLNLYTHGRTAIARRGKKRRKVIEQAVSYAVEWHNSKAVGAGRGVIAAAYTNEHGLVQLAWLLGRPGPSLGEDHSRLCVLVCREGEALQPSDVECVATSLRDAGYTFLGL